MTEFMKKLFVLIMCLLLALSAAACGGKDKENGDSPLSGIRTATADKEDKDEKEEKDESELDEDTDDEKDDIGEEKVSEEYNPDRTEASDRQELKNFLRDAKELIEEGYFEDAEMILEVVRSRDLTADEKKELLELEKMMLVVSD